MAMSLFDQDLYYMLNFFRIKKIRDGLLLTTDFGSWIYLSMEEFNLLKSNRLNENTELFNLLKDKGIILTRTNMESIIEKTKNRFNFLTRGAYHHIILKNNNIKKLVSFISQSSSNPFIEIRDKNSAKEIIESFKDRNVSFKVFSDLEGIEYLIDNKVEIWTDYDNLKDKDKITRIQRKYPVNVEVDVNNKSEIKEILSDLKDLKIRYFSLKSSLKNEEFLPIWKETIAQLIEINREHHLREMLTTALFNKILTSHIDIPEFQSFCSGAGINQLTYENNEIFAGDNNLEIFKLGTLDKSYNEIMNSEELKSIIMASIDGNLSFDNNPYMPFIGFNPVSAWKETSNIIPKLPSNRFNLYTEMLDFLFESLIFNKETSNLFSRHR